VHVKSNRVGDKNTLNYQKGEAMPIKAPLNYAIFANYLRTKRL